MAAMKLPIWPGLRKLAKSYLNHMSVLLWTPPHLIYVLILVVVRKVHNIPTSLFLLCPCINESKMVGRRIMEKTPETNISTITLTINQKSSHASKYLKLWEPIYLDKHTTSIYITNWKSSSTLVWYMLFESVIVCNWRLIAKEILLQSKASLPRNAMAGIIFCKHQDNDTILLRARVLETKKK